MKRQLILCAAAMMAALFSCTRENEKVTTSDQTDEIARLADDEFLAVIDVSDTKTTIKPTGLVEWKQNDTISVNGAFYVVSRLNSPTEAVFKYLKGPKPREGAPLCAFYPYNIQSTDSLGVLPQRWKYNPGTVTTVPMYAHSENKMLKFKNICGLLKITVPSDSTVRLIQISNFFKQLAGTFVVHDDDSISITGGVDPNLVFLECDDNLEGVPGTDFYYPVPAGKYEWFDVTVSTPNGSYTMRTKVSPINISLNTIYPITFDFEQGRAYGSLEEECNFMYDLLYKILASGTAEYSSLFSAFQLTGPEAMAAGYDGHSDLRNVNTFTYGKDSPVIEKSFFDIYNALYRVTSIISFCPPQSQEEAKYFAELRVIRVYLHLLLFEGWHKPFILNTPITSEDCLNPVTANDMLKFLIDELDASLSYLEEKASLEDPTGAMHVTEGFYYALKGKILLIKGDFADAAKSFGDVERSGKYGIISGDQFSILFHSEGNGCVEKIFELKGTPTSAHLALSDWRSQAFVADPASTYTGGVQGKGCLGVRRSFAEAFYKHDENGISYRFKASLMNIEDAVYATDTNMKYTDPELSGMTPEQRKASPKVGIISEGMECQSFWLPMKSLSRPSDEGTARFTVMRYAEVLLLHAEALFMSGHPDQAKEYVNKVRERAGLGQVGSVTLDYIKEEMRYELCFEGVNWFNEIRWNWTYNDEQPVRDSKPLENNRTVTTLYDKLHRAPEAGEKVIWQHETEEASRFYLKEENLGTGGLDRYVYFPYPPEFMGRVQGENMEQYEGWN